MKTQASNGTLNHSLLRGCGLAFLIVALALRTTDALATLIAYEPFNYTSGGQVNAATAAPTGTPTQSTAGGWTGDWVGAATVNSFTLGYPSLPTTSKSMVSLGANNCYTHIASAPTSGTVWVSFLFKQAGDNGGNRNGVFLENSAGTGVMLAYQQYSGTQGQPCLVAMTGTTSAGTQIATSTKLQTYLNTNLYVLGFTYTAGTVSSISVYCNPVAGQATPPAPDFTVSSGFGSIGALVNFGLYDSAAETITLDEFRVADSFSDVVGLSALPVTVSLTSPTNNQTVSIYNFNVDATASVLPGSITNVSLYLDGSLVGDLTSAPYVFDLTGTAAGAHTLQAVAMDGNGNAATSSVVNITAADLPPSVSITNPVAGTQFLTGSTVTLGAQAADDGSIASVTFYVDGAPVGSSVASPYATTWTATAGAHALTAVAQDNAGQTTTSAVVNITGTLPTVAITTPTNAQAVSIYSFSINATATVSPGTITNVAFYVDSSLIANVTGAPFTCNVLGASVGAHSLYAVATDGDGNAVTSSVVNVMAADLPPSVTVTNPVNGSQFLVGSSVALGASAADDNAVTNVAFYVDGLFIGNATASPYGTPWVATAGAHALTAVATDSAGQSTTSAVVNIVGTLPVVAITNPTNTQAVSIYNFQIAASASVSPGTITNVAFYVDSVEVANDTASPYQYTVTGASAGAHALYAVATDSNGNAVTSSVVNVTAADLPPSVTLTNPAAGSAFLSGATVTLGASASDDNSVTNVAFYVDGALVGNSITSPYVATWTMTSLGVHALTAVAYDNIGQSTTSAVVNVNGVLNFNAYEPFNYSLGAFTNGTVSTAAGFKGGWTCGAAGTIVAGLSYASLPTVNDALQCNGGYQVESLSGTPSSSIIWVSVLFQQAGDNGGNRSGFLMEDATGRGLMFAYTQASGSQGYPSLVNVTATNTVGTTLSTKSATLRTYNTAHLYVFKLNYTAGVLTSASVYSDPTAAQSTSPTADFTVTGLTGTGPLSLLGVGSPSGEAITIDEIRTGATFGSVVGVPLPSAPTALTALPGNSQVSLTWNAPLTGAATGYNVKRSTQSGLETTIASVAGTTYTDATAVNGTTYYYVVSGTNAAGEGYNSAEVSTVPVAPPGQVQNVSAFAGVNSVSLGWTATPQATGYLVLRGTASGVYTVTNATASNADTDLTAAGGTTYYYVVEATNAAGIGPISSEVSALPQIGLPGAPSALAAVPSSGQVNLNWSAGTGAASYNVKRSITSGSEATIGSALGTTYLDATAIDGNIYYYQVSSTNAAGESANSSEIVVAMPPAIPTGLSAMPGANQVALNWTASSGASAATSYNVKRSTISGSEVTIGTISGTSYTDTTAISGTTYYYVVAGMNASGPGANSAETSAVPTGAPQAPTALTITTNYTSLTLAWTAAAGAPTGYNVKRSTVSGAETTLPAGTNVADATFTDNTVVVGTEYFYTVSAVNNDGEGPDSAEVTGVAPGSPAAYESFDYSSLANGTATTGNGFTGNWQITNGAAIVSGLTHPYLYTSNNALEVSSGNQYENLSVPLFSGTVYVSFLFDQSGDNGGNRGGFELLNQQGNGVMFAYHQYGGTVGLPSVDAVSGYVVGSELGASVTPQTYATANLYVLRLNYNASGVLTNLAVISNPGPGQAEPAPDFTVSTGLSGIGTITTMGMATELPTTVDEWRVGTNFSDVVIGESFATVTLGDLSQTYDGTPKSVTTTVTPSDLTVTLTYNGLAAAPTNAGTYLVIGTVVDPSNNYYGGVTNNLVIEQAAATVILGDLSQVYNGTAESATATTTPAGLTVTLTYDGSSAAPTNVGSYVVVGTVSDLNYSGSATNDLVIASNVNTAPTNVTATVSGNLLTLSWPADHTGWTLQSQTNNLSTGLTGVWYDVAQSTTTNQVVIPIDPTQPAVFYRMKY